ncbi:MAG: fibronectin type III domain-containing protein, partial [Ignavibacteriaceae bacterium]|nr:fibronectin type III domain-containing protein [Ignavibacteriaceae bacterium]
MNFFTPRFARRIFFISVLALFSFKITAQPINFNGNGNLGVSMNILSADYYSTTIEFIFNGYNQQPINIKGKEYLFLSAPEMIWMMEKGFPQIPIFKGSIIIPDEAAMNYKIVDEEFSTISTGVIAPSKGHFTRDINPNTVPYTFNKIYGEDTWYPSNKVGISEPYIVRDLRGMTIQFNPIQYNPKLEKLKIYRRLVLKVYADNSVPNVNPLIRNIPMKGITGEFENIYKTLFYNYGKGVFDYTPIPEPGRLVIIYAANYAQQVLPLYNWKIEKGVPTLLAEYPTVTGSGANAIKTYIQNLYNQPEGITYIILVGESAEIPTLLGVSESAASDPCFVKLAGADAYPDAYISRISPTSAANCAYIVKKILKYEKYPDTGAQAGWYYKTTGVASDENGSTPLYDWQRMNLLRDTLFNHGFTSMDQIYDPGATTAQVAAAINDGRSIVNYIGHGSGSSWSTSSFNVSAIRNLNNGYKNPFIIDVACQNGAFTMSECMEEAWIRAGDTLNPKGAIAVYGASTNTSWVPPCDLQTHSIYLLANKMRSTVGGICFNGVMKAMDLWGGSTGEGLQLMEQYNIFGDCSMVMNFGMMPDSVAPSAITDLTAANPTSNSLTVNWTTPMDSSFGGVVSYDVRCSDAVITSTNFSGCMQFLVSGQNDSTGSLKSFAVSDLAFNTTYYFAIKAKDMWGNTALMSNVTTGTTLGAPALLLSPADSMYVVLEPNEVVTDTLVISNISAGSSSLDYSIEMMNNTFPENLNVKYKIISLKSETPSDRSGDKNNPLVEGGSSVKGFGGPDNFGYNWIDSDELNGPQYVWNDIASTGTLVTNWIQTGTYNATDEGYAGPFNFGFNFKYYGITKTQVYVSSNGYLTFAPVTGSTFTNAAIPTSSTPNEIISPFWDDLDGKTTGKVYYKQDGSNFIIQFQDWQKYSGTGTLTFQIVFSSNGRMMFYYKNMTATLNGASVGIENAAGNDGLQIAYNSTYVKNNLAVKIASEPDWIAGASLAGTIFNGGSALVELTFSGSDYPVGDYKMDFVLTSNDPNHTQIVYPVRMLLNDGSIPVELSSFTAASSEAGVSLNWSTTTETNNRGFVIERSTENNTTWETVSFIQGRGNSTE